MISFWFRFCITMTLSLLSLMQKVQSQGFEDFTVDKDVSIFLDKNFSELKNFQLGIKGFNDDNQLYIDSIDYSPWFVGDFNDDGLLDLFVQGYKRKENQAWLIMATEDPKAFNLHEVKPTLVEGDLNFPVIEETKNGPLIIYKQFMTKKTTKMVKGVEVTFPKNYNSWYGMGFLRKDTLIYRHNAIIEYNPNPSHSPIRFMQIHRYCQFGGCPDYKLKIDSSGGMILQNIRNTELEPGVYKANCDADQYRILNNMLNYLRLPESDKRYGDRNADHVITIWIKRMDGTEKKIMDFDLQGTLGLIQLYDQIEEIRKKTLW
ncbi:MAG: DUF6438 domain-containing protein [Saprospiraceae bacterium]